MNYIKQYKQKQLEILEIKKSLIKDLQDKFLKNPPKKVGCMSLINFSDIKESWDVKSFLYPNYDLEDVCNMILHSTDLEQTLTNIVQYGKKEINGKDFYRKIIFEIADFLEIYLEK